METLLLVGVGNKPTEMAKQSVPISFSCTQALLDRLNSQFHGGRKRSAFIVDCIGKGLEELDHRIEIENRRDSWITEKVIPALKKILKKSDWHTIYFIMEHEDRRGVVKSQLESAGVLIDDDDLTRAFELVLKDYD